MRERLEQGLTQGPGSGGPDRHTCWLATVGPDGRPHVMPFGALWEGNEEQRGRPGILALVAGGHASEATQTLVAKEGPQALVRELEWLGSEGDCKELEMVPVEEN